MRTVSLILEAASPLQPGLHLKIENPPWMALAIGAQQGFSVSHLLESPAFASGLSLEGLRRKYLFCKRELKS